ncbi:MAG: acylpyruvate hydrolase [Pseudonocardiales bacterium]|nr:acylpyruvate hydrolase [Pseudonocardiales bacterium]
MRLATLATDTGPTAVVVRTDGLVPIDGYRDVGALLRDTSGGVQAAQVAEQTGTAVPLEPARLLRPVLDPGAVVCVGLNYRTHILEMGRELPTEPTLFSKLPRALTDPYADVELPAASAKVDYEAELAVVIGNGGRNIAYEDAWSHVAGLTILNDVTARDYQRRTIQWFAGKTFQRSTPVGPWIVTPDELGDLSELELRLTVNGEERQRAKLGDLVFDVSALVADLSRIVELEPGDMIATGTPGGVGEPQGTFLHPGDEVEVSIDGIGAIRNTFREVDA